MKTIILLITLTILSTNLNAQNWGGTTPGNIYYNSGNVGIGLTNPNFGLSINSIEDQTILGGNTKSVIRLMNGYGNAFGRRSEIQFGLSQLPNELLAVIAAEYSSWNGFIGGDLLFGTTPTNSSAIFERMRIKWDGNVGIGTNNPSAKLDIFGANSNSTNLILSANYIDKYRWRLKTIDRGNAIDMDFTASDGADNEETILKLTRSNSTRPEFQLYNNAIVANNGNVGIGTENTANAKLTVAGDINSREVRVTINAGSDFVFLDNYDLRTLAEVEQFINKNKHLPDIESAEEMKKNGLELGKMDMKLLQKIEELTIYMIEFNKEMEKLKEENKKLKEEIMKLNKD